MNKAAVCFLVLVVPFDRIIKVSFDLEQNPKVRVLCVQRLVDFMVSDKYHLHVQRYWLRNESLSAGNSELSTMTLTSYLRNRKSGRPFSIGLCCSASGFSSVPPGVKSSVFSMISSLSSLRC